MKLDLLMLISAKHDNSHEFELEGVVLSGQIYSGCIKRAYLIYRTLLVENTKRLEIS